MSTNKAPLAIIYDFDGTLAPGNMQERNFIPDIGMTSNDFWQEVNRLAEQHEADYILVYMALMLKKAKAKEVPVRKKDIQDYGKNIKFFPGVTDYEDGNEGVEDWFTRLNDYAEKQTIDLQHYIISCGIKEMIEGTSINKYFSKVYASSFWYDHYDIAKRPALAMNYTTKTQFLFRINKGSHEVHKHDKINAYVPHKNRPVPFTNMAYIGDGDTDIPCFGLVRDQDGHAIAVYDNEKKDADAKAKELVKHGRANFITAADYRKGGELEKIIKRIIDKIKADNELAKLSSL